MKHNQVGDAPHAFRAPVQMSGPPGDWDALIRAYVLWGVAIAGLCLGAAGFLIALGNANQTRAFAEKANQASVLVTQKAENANLSARQTELQQSVERLEKTLDSLGADANNTVFGLLTLGRGDSFGGIRLIDGEAMIRGAHSWRLSLTT